MVSFLRLMVVVIAIIFYQLETVTMYPYPFTSLVAPINKHIDAAKPLYSVEIMSKNENADYLFRNLLIDIEAPLTWHQCLLKDSQVGPFFCPYDDTLCNWPLGCNEDPCAQLQVADSYQNPSSCPNIYNVPRPRSVDTCACPVNVLDPVTGSCDVAFVNYDHFTMHTSKGANFLTDLHTAYPNAACADDSSEAAFELFPANVTGVMALSSSPYVLSNTLYFPHAKTIAMCLPSTLSSSGILFIGKGPYYLLPQSDVDVTTYLSYTPLLDPQTTFEYYIGVDAIVIKKRSISIPPNTTAKLSTNNPYTILRTDIYSSLIQRVSKVTKKIPRANPIAPFSLCFKTTSNKDPSKVSSIKIPDIDFTLQGGKNWTMSTTNTVKQVTKDAACVAFVDGGAMTSSGPAMVIGSFQFEDNFVVFDVENSMFGFSSSLLRKQTSCSNFNFTITKN
uniref:chitinase CLP-like n=1 Tax=Erigeron canadensis TaxID=72917 RepID=UPI001CB8E7CD|nr:chitinase CLP-like [Erigeron canadensis]